MTLPYTPHSFERALEGIAAAGYKYISFGLPHAAIDVPDEEDQETGAKLKVLFDKYQVQPIQLIANAQFAPGQPLERALKRIQLAQELGIPEIITVGAGGYKRFPDELLPAEEMAQKHREFVEQYQRIAEAALPYDVTITIKPHTGNTATAKDVMQTLSDIGAPNVKGCYDPGNVQFYEGVNAAQDFPQMVKSTFSIIAKDHKGERANLDFPIPGTGDVDFLQIFQDWKAAGGDGNVVIERIDGPGEPNPAVIDERVAKSYQSVKGLLQQAGLTVQ
jgi:sugar phosphate isomerase/epimerase